MTKHTTLKPTKPDSQLQSDQQKITWLNSIIITFSVVIIGVAPLDVPLRDQYLSYTLNTELDNLMVSIEIAGVDSIEVDKTIFINVVEEIVVEMCFLEELNRDEDYMATYIQVTTVC